MKNKFFKKVLDETPAEVEIYVRLYADLVLRIHQVMKEKGLNQKELAAKLEKKPSEISKWLNGEHNFTFKSVAKLQAVLGASLLEVPASKPVTNFQTASTVRLSMYKAIEKPRRNKSKIIPLKTKRINEGAYVNAG